MRKVSAGDPLTIRAADWNQLVDIAATHRFNSPTSALSQSAAAGPDPGDKHNRIRLRNLTGEYRRRGEILQIDQPITTLLDPAYIGLDGVTPTAGYHCYGVLQQDVGNPAIDEKPIAVAAVSGATLALVCVHDTSHQYADVYPGDCLLHSSESGPFPILSPITGACEQELLILLPTACVDAQTTTTTRETLYTPECSGRCKWTANASLQWELTESTCTDPTTTTGPETTTTGCCRKPGTTAEPTTAAPPTTTTAAPTTTTTVAAATTTTTCECLAYDCEYECLGGLWWRTGLPCGWLNDCVQCQCDADLTLPCVEEATSSGHCRYVSQTTAPPATTAAPTTTTAAPTTTTTAGPTTTTTPGPTTTTTPECDCLPPTFCPTAEGECTYTDCSREQPDPKTCPSTSTAPPTTTTCDCGAEDCTPCQNGCDWVGVPTQAGNWMWLLSNYGCADSCPCARPTSDPTCATVHTDCVIPPPTTPPPEPPCHGMCKWTWVATLGQYYSWPWGCSGGNRCECQPPTEPGLCTTPECCDVYTPCVELAAATTGDPTSTTGDPTSPSHCWYVCCGTTTTAHSTTTTPGSCAEGGCKWKSDVTGLLWEGPSDDTCPTQCPCVEPSEPPRDTCETRLSACDTTQPPTTTTAPPTTTTAAPTTTTTGHCDAGHCLYSCVDASWVLAGQTCWQYGCVCGPPPEGSCEPAQEYNAGCVHTSTTTAAPTSTSLDPGTTSPP